MKSGGETLVQFAEFASGVFPCGGYSAEVID
jgi:hypothetical protein